MQGKLPTRQQIERRAYEIYAKRCGQSGNDMADRIAAEKELTSRLKCKAAEPSSLEHQQDCTATRMLLDFHGLREQPFGMTPDPAYLYASRTHGEAFASLSFGIQDNRGFLALIAEPGMGKDTRCSKNSYIHIQCRKSGRISPKRSITAVNVSSMSRAIWTLLRRIVRKGQSVNSQQGGISENPK